ncbi:secretory calcium-binding phosphoprotein 8 isoform X3 [Paralichthys olivaceus]
MTQTHFDLGPCSNAAERRRDKGHEPITRGSPVEDVGDRTARWSFLIKIFIGSGDEDNSHHPTLLHNFIRPCLFLLF